MGHWEEWDLYDAQGSRTGQKIKRGEPIPPGSYHRVVSVWLVNGKTEVLLSQRHPEKSYPLLWECTGGCVIAGETSLEGAVREVREELGICLEPKRGSGSPACAGKRRRTCMTYGSFAGMGSQDPCSPPRWWTRNGSLCRRC